MSHIDLPEVIKLLQSYPCDDPARAAMMVHLALMHELDVSVPETIQTEVNIFKLIDVVSKYGHTSGPIVNFIMDVCDDGTAVDFPSWTPGVLYCLVQTQRIRDELVDDIARCFTVIVTEAQIMVNIGVVIDLRVCVQDD